MYNAGVSKKVIEEKTGCPSLSRLRQYRKTSGEQQCTVSRILASCGGKPLIIELICS